MLTIIIPTALTIVAYLAAAIPTGYWIGRVFCGTDLTKHGSGNIGASNAARVLGKKLFFPIFFIDAGKAFALLYFSQIILAKFYMKPQILNYTMIVAMAILIGNAYSIFIGFKGGKGVASSLGLVAYFLSFKFAVAFAFFWIAILATTKHAFIASLGAMFLLIVTFLTVGSHKDFQPQLFLLGLIFLWMIFRHQENIRKLLKS